VNSATEAATSRRATIVIVKAKFYRLQALWTEREKSSLVVAGEDGERSGLNLSVIRINFVLAVLSWIFA
jgi:hypothetical protein